MVLKSKYIHFRIKFDNFLGFREKKLCDYGIVAKLYLAHSFPSCNLKIKTY